jgi:hypothetical protein
MHVNVTTPNFPLICPSSFPLTPPYKPPSNNQIDPKKILEEGSSKDLIQLKIVPGVSMDDHDEETGKMYKICNIFNPFS